MTGYSFELLDSTIVLEGFPSERATLLRRQAEHLRLVDKELEWQEIRDAYIDPLRPLPSGAFAGGVAGPSGAPVALAQTVRSDVGIAVGGKIGTRVEVAQRLKEAIYGGVIFSGYGHIILETINRLWCAREIGFLPIIFLTHLRQPKIGGSLTLVAEIAGMCGIDPERIVLCSAPTSVDRLIVPEAGLQLGIYTNFNHLRFLRNSVPSPLSVGTAASFAYISRSKLPDIMRKPVGEELLEQLLQANKFDVFWPESHNLPEQINIFNSYDNYVSFIGSQMHTMLFRKSNRATDCIYFCSENPNINFLQIDATFPGRRLYRVCADYAPVFEFGNRAPFRIDYAAASSALEFIGIRLALAGTCSVDEGDGYIYKWGYALFYHKLFRRWAVSMTAEGRSEAEAQFCSAMARIISRLKAVDEPKRLGPPLLRAFDQVSAAYQMKEVPVVTEARHAIIDSLC
jgi:hypothetical protein